MKTIKPLLLIALSMLLVLASCTMQKRTYMPGYHVEWLKSKQHPGKDELSVKENVKKTDDRKALSEEHPVISNNTTSPARTASASYSSGSFSVHEPAKKVTTASRNTQPHTAKTKTLSERKKAPVTWGNKKKDDSNGFMRGLLMIVLAFAMLALGYLFYTMLGVFGVILLLIFGIGAAVILIAGIIIMIAG